MKCWWEWISFRICDLGKRQMTNGKDYADNAVLPQAQISWSIISNQPKKLVCIFRMISSVQPSRKGLVYRIGRCLQSIASQYKHAQLSSCLLHYGKVQTARKQKSPLDNNDHMGEIKNRPRSKNWFNPHAPPPKCSTHHWNRLHTKPTTLCHNILVCKTRF